MSSFVVPPEELKKAFANHDVNCGFAEAPSELVHSN
jgi:hypothetical protein